MRIIHFALSCFYIEGYKYQENVIPSIHAREGHTVLMVASCVSFNEQGKPCTIKPTKYRSNDGFDVVRVPYKKPFTTKLLRRVRLYEGVYDIINDFKPDIMYFHGCSALELNTIVSYKRKHPEVVLFIDNHADRNNSASSYVSLIFQHKMLYKPSLKRALPYTEKLLCPSIECMDFCKEVYGVPEDKLEFYPLGGTIFTANQREEIRSDVRMHENVGTDSIIFTHSGKMDARKRTTDIIKAFKSVKNEKFRLWIIGVLMEDVKDLVLEEISTDERIEYLGWKNGDELLRYLCASDFYVQPGGQSATMQSAMCCGCAVMLYPYKSHKPYLDGNGFYISTVEDMERAFLEVSNNIELIPKMKSNSFKIANNILDYNKIAARITNSITRENKQ